MSTTSLDAYWADLVTAALLGTDRRDPPLPPWGGLADLAADDPQPTPSSRLLQQVAATVVVRRAGVVAAPPLATPAPPDPDPRPVTPPGATDTWHRVVADWPVLEDEWLLAVVRSGHRLAPELVVPVLHRHRTDAVRHARAMAAAGPLGAWMTDWSPRLACTARAPASPESVAELPELAITPELLPLLHAPPREVAAEVAGGLSAGRHGISAKGVLVHLVARVQPRSLPSLARALDRVDPAQPSIGIAFALADLARLRHHGLAELAPAELAPTGPTATELTPTELTPTELTPTEPTPTGLETE